MSNRAYICPACGKTFPLDRPLWRCPCAQSHVSLTPGAGLSPDEIDRNCRSLWRYRAALAFSDSPSITLGEGCTPLIETEWKGSNVLFKLEFFAASGSFKDRGISVMVNYLNSLGIDRVVEDSSGNGGAALAAYSAAAGMSCRILVPEGTSAPKIIQIAAYGAEVVVVPGTRQDVADAALVEAERRFYASHNWQPFFLEGIKTVGYEIWEDLGFSAPDNIVVPYGGGSNLLGCFTAFSELRQRGLIKQVPRLFAVQAANCSPLQMAFDANADAFVPCEVTSTLAEGIAVSRPIRIREGLAALRETNGSVVSVSEQEILAALRALAHKGLFVEPTSATAVAGLIKLNDSGIIGSNKKTVIILTGTGLKATQKIGDGLSLSPAH